MATLPHGTHARFTARDLHDILSTQEFKTDLEDMSSYLASIKQERPIVYWLAKYLWKQHRIFSLEDKKRDLVVGATTVEFKLNFDCDLGEFTKRALETYRGRLNEMWDDVLAKRISKSWNTLPPIYQDMCVKKDTDIFVWIVYSRNLGEVPPGELHRICWSPAQRAYDAAYPYGSKERDFLSVANNVLEEVRKVRPFGQSCKEITVNGTFPSTYHFLICEFPANSPGHRVLSL